MIQNILNKLVTYQDLNVDEMESVMLAFMQGELNDTQGAAFLTAMKMKTANADEIYAAAKIMRQLASKVTVSHPELLVDPVGTGGATRSLVNISTAASIVASCANVRIAKHGSRAASSKSGSADLLEVAGVNINLDVTQLAQCVEDFGIGFLYAPLLHSAMKNVMSVRRALGFPTFFNLLGPLTNPANAKKQVLGVADISYQEKMALAAQKLGQTRVLVISSEDGLDEISIAAPSKLIEVSPDRIVHRTFDPRDWGIHHSNLDAVVAENPQASLAAIECAFSGNSGAVADMIALNAAAIIYVANASDTDDFTARYDESLIMARGILESGNAKRRFSDYIAYTQQF